MDSSQVKELEKFLVFNSFSSVFIGFRWFSLVFICFHFGFHWFSVPVTAFHQVQENCNGFFSKVLWSFTGVYQDLPRFTAFLGFYGFFFGFLLDFIRF